MEWNNEAGYPPAVRERLKVVELIGRKNLDAINARIEVARHAPVQPKLDALMNSRDPVWVRLRALYALADEEAGFYGENVACRRGCAHCCHIAVGMKQPEAEMLGRALKRRPKKVAETNLSTFDYGYHNPCTFLKNDECSIYAHRPPCVPDLLQCRHRRAALPDHSTADPDGSRNQYCGIPRGVSCHLRPGQDGGHPPILSATRAGSLARKSGMKKVGETGPRFLFAEWEERYDPTVDEAIRFCERIAKSAQPVDSQGAKRG